VGSGAGFPAIPLKIAFPDLRITMLDSLGKRVNFLKEVISELGLKEITALHGRAEDLARDPGHRETYDYVVSRAVANMNTLSEYCLPFVKEGGYFLAYKSLEYLSGGEREGSEKAIGLLGGRTVEVRQIDLPEWDAKRCLVFIRKESPTPKKFPRKAGLPSKEPL
jgi:16S rRNA (guanine527-N7)-methyltransferase